MKELVAAGNALTHLMIQLLHPKLENATIGYFDSYGFFNDIYENPVWRSLTCDLHPSYYTPRPNT